MIDISQSQTGEHGICHLVGISNTFILTRKKNHFNCWLTTWQADRLPDCFILSTDKFPIKACSDSAKNSNRHESFKSQLIYSAVIQERAIKLKTSMKLEVREEKMMAATKVSSNYLSRLFGVCLLLFSHRTNKKL